MSPILPGLLAAAQHDTGALFSAMGMLDYAVIALYLLATMAIGTWMCRGQSTLGEYFLAERKTHWFVACVSIIATDVSAMSYMGTPAWVYQKDLRQPAGLILLPLIMLLVVLVFVPLYYRLNVFTVYEYLERRFSPLVRTVVAVLFLLQRSVLLAGAIYVPSLALEMFTGIPRVWCIVIVGVATIVYTFFGGMKAVIWTDFMQFFVMVGGLVLMIWVLLASQHWDFERVWAEASTISADTGNEHTRMFDFRLNLEDESTFWVLLLFFSVYSIGTYGTDQVIVQRYFTMGSMREITKSVLGAGFLLMLMVWALAYLGILLLVYYQQHPELAATLPLTASGMPQSDYILPHFVVNELPVGARGLIFAAILAATMSTVSSGLNSFVTVGTMDLYQRFRPSARVDEAQSLTIARMMTLVSGAILTALAVWIGTYQTTILQTITNLAIKFIGPISAIFFLGILTRRANVPGVLVGAAAGLSFSLASGYEPIASQINWMWAGPLSCLITFVVGYVASVGATMLGHRSTS